MDEPKPLTFSDRLEILFGKIRKKEEMLLRVKEVLAKESKELKKDLPAMISKRFSCIICGLPRLDQDVTGMTCGNPACYHELEKKFIKLEEDSETLHDLAKTAGLLKKDGEFNALELEGRIEDKTKMAETIAEIAKMIGVNPSQSIEALCEAVKVEIANMEFSLKQIE